MKKELDNYDKRQKKKLKGNSTIITMLYGQN